MKEVDNVIETVEPVVGAAAVAIHYQSPVFMTKDGATVVNRIDSHVAGAACYYLRDAIAQVVTKKREYLVKAIEFPFIIGNSNVVETTAADKIIWARRLRRFGWSRCVVGRQPEPSNFFTLVLKRMEEDPSGMSYLLISGWIGKPTAPEPEDISKFSQRHVQGEKDKVKEDSRAFWQNHAFCLEKIPIYYGSERDHNPYEGMEVPVKRWRKKR